MTTSQVNDAGRELIVSVFDAKEYDRDNLTKAFKNLTINGRRVLLRFLDAKLSESSVALAAGSQAICMFVNDSATPAVLRTLKELGVEFVALRCAGFNMIDLPVAKSLGLTVARVPAYSPHAVAEHALALLMAVTRKTHVAYNRCRNGDFHLAGLTGRDLHGKTAAVVGTGKIGRCFALIAHGLGMKVLLWDKYPNAKFAASIGARYVADFDDVLPLADVLSFHVPLLPATHHMLNENNLHKCKRGMVVLNVARGPIVCADTLLKGILSGRIGGAGLDVYEHEKQFFFEDVSGKPLLDNTLARLINLPHSVIVTSHQAFLTKEALTAIAQTTRQNIVEYFGQNKRGDELTNVVPPVPKSEKKLVSKL